MTEWRHFHSAVGIRPLSASVLQQPMLPLDVSVVGLPAVASVPDDVAFSHTIGHI